MSGHRETREIDPVGALLARNVGYVVRRAQLRIFDDFYRVFAASVITPARFSALLLIRATPGIRATDLAAALGIARSGVVKLLAPLEEQGLISRAAVDADRRTQALMLTTAGDAELNRVEQAVAAHEARICANLSTAEREQLIALLQRVATDNNNEDKQ